jgi:hypothetical protein
MVNRYIDNSIFYQGCLVIVPDCIFKATRAIKNNEAYGYLEERAGNFDAAANLENIFAFSQKNVPHFERVQVRHNFAYSSLAVLLKTIELENQTPAYVD